LVRPTLSFDERGHTENKTTYAVLGVDEHGAPPTRFYPLTEDFVGEGGSLDWPEAVVNAQPHHAVGEGATFDGYEAMGGLLFPGIDFQPGESNTYILVLGILSEGRRPETLIEAYGSGEKFNVELEKTCQMWEAKRSRLSVHTGDTNFDRWMNWVAVQPTLRRLFGNSFLPYHDYGRGGRGWRDLWQDVLALLIQEPGDVSAQLWGYFAGVRMDGSNATIIGSEPGEFIADRNNIPRVWMDHGAWPLLTTKLYLDLTGDLGFLLRKQTYFKDHLADRVKKLDESWQPEQGMQLQDETGQVYLGTVLEHLLVQNLVPFFNVGEHNIIRLEDADWNDGLDLAPERGESVAFSALYAGNLEELSELVLALEKLPITQVEVAAELLLLLDTLGDPVDYRAITGKQARLAQFFENCRSKVSGKTIPVPLRDLATDLQKKAAWLAQHIRSQEWVENAEGFGWFNGYYDNDGRRVEGDHERGTRMTLTGQVFTLMGRVATDGQAREMIRAADRYLLDPQIGGYRLNTDFDQVLLKLGRAFGFAFGHKENGAMFSHMAVMYANALYQRGFVQEGYKVLEGIYSQSTDFKVSRMYPGIPEYFNNRGRGMYPYLTGSASWYLLTFVTEVFGVKGRLGDLELSPKLMRSQFDPQGIASVTTVFAGRRLNITYHNTEHLDYGAYQIGTIEIDGHPQVYEHMGSGGILPRQVIVNAPDNETAHITATLVSKK
jgi:cellobiose phosphorylase